MAVDPSTASTLPMAEALRLSEEKYAKAFHISPDAVLISSVADGRILEANDSFLRLSGYTREEVIGRRTQDLNVWRNIDDRAALLSALQANGGVVRDMEYAFQSRAGRQGTGLVSAHLIEIAGEQCLITVARDVTDQKLAEIERERLRLELEQQMRLLDAILSTTPDHFHVHDREGRYLYASPIALQAVRLTAEQVIGKNWRDLDFPAEEGQRFEERLKIVFDTGQTLKAEVTFPIGDVPRYYEQILSPLRDPSGCVVMALSTVHDITERKLTEQLIQHYANEVLARNEDLEAFARTVAHDLKSPLSNIVGFVEWLQSRPDLPPDERREYIDIIARNAIKMNGIIDELLLLAQIRKEQVELIPIDTTRLISEAQARLAFMIAESNVVMRVPGSWPTALGYGPWVEEVWVNYLSNAIKYGRLPPATPRIELGFDELSDHFIRFWVRDFGPGIPLEEQVTLFKAFGEHSKVRATGHGLGLSIVRMIVEKMGGQVGVDSTVGQGSTFYFTLPALE
ncbi:MAG TPA: PAS domain S-box protein [Anaerolineae bacterium]|nr:PAS domain S-box protein [Anaerolineae bacterium]